MVIKNLSPHNKYKAIQYAKSENPKLNDTDILELDIKRAFTWHEPYTIEGFNYWHSIYYNTPQIIKSSKTIELNNDDKYPLTDEEYTHIGKLLGWVQNDTKPFFFIKRKVNTFISSMFCVLYNYNPRVSVKIYEYLKECGYTVKL